MPDPGHVAVGAWSGGRFMHFGEPLDDDRLTDLLRPGGGIDTILTADVYGEGEGDSMVGRALAGVPRADYCLVGAVGHDFYEGERGGPRGFPRFTDPRLRGPDKYADYLQMATERSLERCGVDAFDLLLLHNPDRIGYTSSAVWRAMDGLHAQGLTRSVGIAPGPANGFTLDLIDCLDRFGSVIDWAMVILNPLEPWPGELVLPAAVARETRVITRVVDYGGLFHGDLQPGHVLAPGDHRRFRPEGWLERGLLKLGRMLPLAEIHGLTPLQLACHWNLSQPAVKCCVPTLIQEAGPDARPIEEKRADLAATPAKPLLAINEVSKIRRIGDNKGGMTLKGGVPGNDGDERPDRWPLSEDLTLAGARWGINPERDLTPGVV